MFLIRTWKDRNVEYPMRRKLVREDGTYEIVTIERFEGNVLEWGDAWNADNMNDLEDRIAKAINDLDIIADIETSVQESSRSYNYGDYFILEGTLYMVVAPIDIYSPIEIGDNVIQIGVMNQIHDIENSKLFILERNKWSADMVTEAGSDYFIYDLEVDRIFADTIYAKVGNETEELIASAEQREAYNMIVDAKGDTDTMTIRFYATDLPDIDVPIWIRGVI